MSDGFDLGGGSGRNFSFGPQGSQPGAFVSGLVVDMQEVQETNYDTKALEFWDDGRPKMQYKVTLATELRDPLDPSDDGQRNVYLNGYRKPHPKNGTSSTLYAVLEAVKAVTGGSQLQRGGKLTLQWVSGMGFTGDPRHYQAWYEAPAVNLDGPPNPAAAQPPAQAAPPAQPQTPPQQAAQPPAWAGPAPTQQAAPAAAPAAAPPAAQAPPQAAAPAQGAPLVPSEQGMVNPATGELADPAAAKIAALKAAGVSDEAIAGMRAAGQI